MDAAPPARGGGLAIGVVVAVEAVGVAGVAAGLHLVWPVWGAVVAFGVWAVLLLVPLAAGRVYGYREPTQDERARLEQPWRDVQRRMGADAYRLVVTDADELNACPPFGRAVAVTSGSAASLPPVQLAAVLGHELGHVLGRGAGPAFARAQVTVSSRALLWAIRKPWSPVAAAWKRAVEWHRPIGFVLVLVLGLVAAAVSVVVAVPAGVGGVAALGARLTGGRAEARADGAAARAGLGAELLAAVEHRIDQAEGLPLPLVRRAQRLRRRLG